MIGAVDELIFPSGMGTLRVVRRAGRIAELRPGPRLPNLLWRGEGATVDGGDRVWLAPEREHFYDDPDDIDSWRCPTEIDPGEWKLDGSDDRAMLRQSVLGAGLCRTIEPVVDLPCPCELPWAAYSVIDELETDRPWSTWHLVMAAAPSRVFVGESTGRVELYSPAPQEEGAWLDAADIAPRWKVGYPPPPSGVGVLAAVGADDPAGMVVLIAEVDPTGTYVDVPLRGGEATALQVFNSGGDGFCELEHHAPLETRRARSIVVGVWGPRPERLAFLESVGLHFSRTDAELPGMSAPESEVYDSSTPASQISSSRRPNRHLYVGIKSPSVQRRLMGGMNQRTNA